MACNNSPGNPVACMFEAELQRLVPVDTVLVEGQAAPEAGLRSAAVWLAAVLHRKLEARRSGRGDLSVLTLLWFYRAHKSPPSSIVSTCRISNTTQGRIGADQHPVMIAII